ncbi:MAG: DOMON-like domain-containing protein [Nitrospirae bacterium]|nr:DOMON-like domain-containing protein [Nitrospirota bacterium]
MNSHRFSLKPFSSVGIPIMIKGSIERHSNRFAISYSLTGALSDVVIPTLAEMPERRDNLWEETCFEIFLGLKDYDQYWEFDLSPSGHWNVYRFNAYREGRQEEEAFTSLPFNVISRTDAFLLNLEFDLDKIIPADKTLKVGISAVIKLRDGNTTPWALAHPFQQADFHKRVSFIIEL